MTLGQLAIIRQLPHVRALAPVNPRPQLERRSLHMSVSVHARAAPLLASRPHETHRTETRSSFQRSCFLCPAQVPPSFEWPWRTPAITPPAAGSVLVMVAQRGRRCPPQRVQRAEVAPAWGHVADPNGGSSFLWASPDMQFIPGTQLYM